MVWSRLNQWLPLPSGSSGPWKGKPLMVPVTTAIPRDGSLALALFGRARMVHEPMVNKTALQRMIGILLMVSHGCCSCERGSSPLPLLITPPNGSHASDCNSRVARKHPRCSLKRRRVRAQRFFGGLGGLKRLKTLHIGDTEGGDGNNARHYYTECLRRFPESGLATAALRMIDSGKSDATAASVANQPSVG